MTEPFRTLTHREVQDMWIEALESGKYAQCKGHLGDEWGYCCLGVLAQLAVDNGVIEGFHPYETILPIPVVSWSGIRNNNGQYDSTSLVRHNDSERMSFLQIAEIIRNNRDSIFYTQE